MRKTSLYIILFALLAVHSFTLELPARSLYIEGTAEQEAHKTFFMDSFRAEAYVMDILVTDSREEAAFTFLFDVQSHSDEYDPYTRYIIFISLYNNETEMEMVSFGWAFAALEDMHERNEILFYTAVALIPGIVREELLVIHVPVPVHDNRWQHNWLYIRASIDYPIAFYLLQPYGLIAGQGAYAGPTDAPVNLQHLEHIIMPRPGVTVGVEVQFFNFMSLELNFQAHFGDPRTYFSLGTAIGARLMFVHRTSTFMLQPYAAVLRVLNFSSEFAQFPSFALGGGAQIGVRGIGNGAFFLDLNFMYFMGDIHRHNPYGELAPNPSLFHYRRFVVGLGIGYKFGLFNRQR